MVKRGALDSNLKYSLREENHLKSKSLSISIKEGTAASVSTSITSNVITPFALELKATTTHISWLNAVAGLLAPLAQFYGDKLMETQSRKTIAKNYVVLQALMLLPLILIGYFYFQGVAPQIWIYVLIATYTLHAAAGGIVYPAWFSWMGDLIPEHKRGKYLGKRYRITETFGVVFMLLSGFFLDMFKPQGVTLLGINFHFTSSIIIGFSILFGFAFLTRMISFLYLRKQYEPAYKQNKEDYFSLWQFLKRMDNFGKFSVGHAIFNFALMVSSPFFAVYMLKDLGLENNYILFTVISMASTVFYILFTKMVGRFSDKYGNRKLFAISCFLFSANPLIWLVIKNPYYLIPIQIVAGFANAAMTIAIHNFTYDSVSQKHRALCITYTNILAGIGTFLGALVGGFLITFGKNYIPFMKPMLFVFLVSAILRWAVSLYIIPKIKETRKVCPLHFPHFHLHAHHHAFPKTLNSELATLKSHHKDTSFVAPSNKTSSRLNLQKV